MMMECTNVSVSLKRKQAKSSASFSAITEAIWFLLSLVLFMILGPFAGPIAIIAVLTCQNNQERETLTEPDCIEPV